MASLRSDFCLYPRLFVGGLMASLRSDFCLYLRLFVGGLMVSLRSDFFLYLRLFVGGLMASLRSDFFLYLRLFVGGLMASLRYWCLFALSVFQHILCRVFALFVFVLCLLYPMLPVSLHCPLLIVPSVFTSVC
jgi:hypothetical protein